MFIRLSSLRMSTRTVSESERSVSEPSGDISAAAGLAPAAGGGGVAAAAGAEAGAAAPCWPTACTVAAKPAAAASTRSRPAVLPKTRSKLIVSGEDASELGSVEMTSPIALSFSEIAPRSLSNDSNGKRASTRYSARPARTFSSSRCSSYSVRVPRMRRSRSTQSRVTSWRPPGFSSSSCWMRRATGRMSAPSSVPVRPTAPTIFASSSTPA